MLRVLKSATILTGLLVIVFFSAQLTTWSERLVLGGGSIVVFLIVAVVVFERIRRLIEGYKTYMSGGAEDGHLIYQEASRKLSFYFKRRSHTIYIPTANKWLETMPDWAKQSKAMIITRVKSQVGKHWSFEDTEEPQRLPRQE